MDLPSSTPLQPYLDRGVLMLMDYGPKLLLALVVLFVGLWIIRRLTNLIRAGFARAQTDITLARFLSNLASLVMKALLFISVASMVGIATTSFVALLGAAGLAIGLALQGSLANFAGGVLILLFRPIRVGDFIEAQSVSGTVAEIQIFNTVLKTPDNKVVIVPNGPLSNGIITNYSKEDRRRVDVIFGIGYDDDIEAARQVIAGEIAKDERIYADPEPIIRVVSLGDSSVNFTVRVWTDAANYWPVNFRLLEQVKLAFDAAGISIPYPQRDVHIFNTEK